jgi:type II restriction/modification system DNA methylase subunit YeeA
MPANHSDLKKFAQSARRQLREQVSARLEQVLKTDSAELREKAAAVQELKSQVAATSKAAVVDRVAYTWFNRFCALRFMDANRYNRIAAVSPAEGFTQPEILQEAKQGYIDADLKGCVDFNRVFDLLSGRLPSADPQQEAYRLLLVGVCNSLNEAMPFLFEPIADYTELLMPPDLLSEHSVLHALREAMTAEACQEVEVIGWLYQFYISERKDEVFEGFRKGNKIEVGDIPAATQLFTPHWIVRYLVENSLGRLWMLNRPGSKLAEQMEYYIRPEESETDFLRVTSPEEIKVCDPACGSGHMLTYAFDLLYAIYEEEGYPAGDIPRLVLEKNLYGIEIDERAGALAAFALAMMARGRNRRFFSRGVMPNICLLENISFTDTELKEYKTGLGEDLFTEPLMFTLKQFEQAKTVGSLIRPVISQVNYTREEINHKGVGGTLFLHEVHERVLKALTQAEYLSPRYHIIVTNPPYMGGTNFNTEIKKFAEQNFPISKNDLFTMFIERIANIVIPGGFIGFMTPFVWMFISSYEKLRNLVLKKFTITTLLRPEYNAFWESAHVPICAFVIYTKYLKGYRGSFIDLRTFYGASIQPIKVIEAINNHECGWFYRASSMDFEQIPGNPIVYWVSDQVRKVFAKNFCLKDIAEPRQGMATSDNDRFIRLWNEVEFTNINLTSSSLGEAKESGKRWFPYNKGGPFRKWYGNNEYVVNWFNDGEDIKSAVKEKYPYLNGKIDYVVKNRDFYFKESITWSFVSSRYFGVRYSKQGAIFDVGGSSVFPSTSDIYWLIGFMCSKLSTYFMQTLNPTLNFQVGNVALLPIVDIKTKKELASAISREIINLAKADWDSSECSWDFLKLPILCNEYKSFTLEATYDAVRKNWIETTTKMRSLEEKINNIFIECYELQNELTADVSLDEVTITCNPNYRYGNDRSESEIEGSLKTDTMREFISYAVGCMFGRYSLDKPGLVLANQGETLADYLRQVPDPSFTPDKDNAIPVLDGDWFSDDITERFKKFLRVTFGDAHYEENLAFIEQAIGRDIRSYFLKEFYTQHLKMYQKRPIYWLFSSPRGSFNVLIYMHRYTKDTVPVILNRYLREFRAKLEARKAIQEHVSISPSASQREKTAALKEIESLKKTLEELRVYERDVLYPLAADPIDIDLDDGVKVNYVKFGKALAKIPGLSE